ncbi:MAG TPA: spore coat protein U domain-containing protein [Burkholderiales bacterium]|nr:spore coat protein U domain-containing protein [Burkholderiales bacterium]
MFLLCATSHAQAVVTCFANVSSISTSFNPLNPTDLVTTGIWSVTCSRALSDPGTTFSFDLEANNGVNFTGQTSRVALAGLYYTYELYRSNSSANSEEWGSVPNRRFTGTVDLTTGTSYTTPSLQFFLRVPAGQAVQPAGIYTDVVTTTLTYPSKSAITSVGTFNIALNSIASCTSVVPASLTFNYISFQGAPATPSANFIVNCTTGLPYTMTLDGLAQPAPINVIDDALNLSYSVQLSSGGGTGTGTDQFHQIMGTMPANQSGTCTVLPCTNAAATNKTRTLTVTY